MVITCKILVEVPHEEKLLNWNMGNAKKGGSSIWKDISRIGAAKHEVGGLLTKGVKLIVGDGSLIKFGKDK